MHCVLCQWLIFIFLYTCILSISVAYVDPGNYQADIQAGATSRYTLLFSVWWSSVLSIYIQILCVRLAFYGKMNLAQAQARHVANQQCMRYMNWAIAEFSTIITDLPEVIGIGIACNIFFDWPYYVGVLLSLLTTMMFLATMNYGMNVLEGIVFLFVFIMAVALFVEMSFVGVDTAELLEGWFVGFKDVGKDDIFSITGILGAVVMPHNLYLHTATLQTRKVEDKDESIRLAVKWSSLETVGPIVFSFFMNMAVVAIAAERVYGQVPDGEQVGLSDFCNFFKAIKGGCAMWGIALLAAGQSSAITTTYTGQYVMDGFLNIQLPVATRAILTRLVAITPCVIVSAAFPNDLNQMINIVNSALAFLLPFAFTPLVAYNCSDVIMGRFVAPKWERYLLHTLCFCIWLINAVAFSSEGGGLGGLFGESVHSMDMSAKKVVLILLEIAFQIFYAWWNWNCIATPVAPAMLAGHQDDELQLTDNTIT
jgi:natural resistance-associated macrophage protein 2